MKSKRACGEKMRGENYRFIFIGSIVLVFLACILSVKTIFLATPLVIGLGAVWNFRNEPFIRRRLLQSGLSLGLAHKSNRVSRSTSNFGTKFRTREGNSNCTSRSSATSSEETFGNAVFSRKRETSKTSGFDFSKSLVPNVGFSSAGAFVFGSSKCGKDSLFQRQARESHFSPTSPVYHRNSFLLEENENSDENYQELRSPGYIFQPTRRLLSANRYYPTHQPRYRQFGSFPSVHLTPSSTPILKVKSVMDAHTPVTIRIAPPTVFTPSPIKLSYPVSPSSPKSPDEPDPCDARTVVAALKENRRKRLHREETLDCDMKRQRCDSSSNSSLSGSNELNAMEEGDPDPIQSLGSKRPATPGPLSEAHASLLQKRHKNNAILSSYSSTKRTAKQMSETVSPASKQVKVSSPVKDRFCQTDSIWPSNNETKETNSPAPNSSGNGSETLPKIQDENEVDGTCAQRKSPFPVLKEGFSPRQNITFYAEIGKSSKLAFNMPGYLPTLEDHQKDKQIEQERLNHLLFGSRKGLESRTPPVVNKGSSLANDQNNKESLSSLSSTKFPIVSDTGSQFKLPAFSSPVSLSSSTAVSVSSPFRSSEKKSGNEENNQANIEEKSATNNSDSTAKSSSFGVGFFSSAINQQKTSQSSNAVANSTPETFMRSTGVALTTASSTSSSPTVQSSTLLPVLSTSLVGTLGSPTSAPSFSESFLKVSSNVTPERSPITTLTTATTTQTSIPTFSLFTSQGIAKTSLSVTPSSQMSSTPKGEAPLLPSEPVTPSGPPPPYQPLSSPSQKTNVASSLPGPTTPSATFQFKADTSKVNTTATNIFLESGRLLTSASPSSVTFSTPNLSSDKKNMSVQQSLVFDPTPASISQAAPSNSTFLSSPRSGVTSVSGSGGMFNFLPPNSGSLTAPTTGTQSDVQFGIPSKSASPFNSSTKVSPHTATTAAPPITNTFGLSTGQTHGTPTVSSTGSTFGQFSSTTNSFSGSSLLGAKPEVGTAFGATTQLGSSFGATTQVGTSFGNLTPSGSTFGTTTPSSSAFGTTTQSGNTFGTATPTGSIFGATPTVGNTFASASQLGNTFSGTSQPGITFGTATQPGSTLGATAQSGNALGTAPQPGSTFGATTQSGNAFGTTTQSGSAFGTTTQSGNAFGTTTQSGNAFGTTTQSGNAFGTTTQSGSVFGGTTQSGSIFGTTKQSGNAFGTTTQPSAPFGASSQPGIAFGTPGQSGSAFGTSTQAGSSFGTTSQSGITFGNAAQAGGTFGATTQPGNTFGSFSVTANTFGTTAPLGSTFGATGQTGNTFGQQSQQTNTFGSSATQPVSFGQQSSTFGSTTQASNMFGSTPFGISSGNRGNEEPFGTPATTQSTFTPVPENKTLFTTPAFANSPFTSPFGNANTNSTAGFGAPPTNTFDANKSVAPAVPVFGASLSSANDSTPFNPGGATPLNFNFSAKPNFNFGSGTSAPAFGTGSPSQPFVFTGGGTPGAPVGGSFFSIGSGSKDRSKVVARKRFPRK